MKFNFTVDEVVEKMMDNADNKHLPDSLSRDGVEHKALAAIPYQMAFGAETCLESSCEFVTQRMNDFILRGWRFHSMLGQDLVVFQFDLDKYDMWYSYLSKKSSKTKKGG